MTFNISAKNTQTIFENYTQLEKMPNEVHEKIFSYLDIQSLLNLSSTNRCLRNRVVKKMLDDIDIYLSNIIIQLGGEKYENEKECLFDLSYKTIKDFLVYYTYEKEGILKPILENEEKCLLDLNDENERLSNLIDEYAKKCLSKLSKYVFLKLKNSKTSIQEVLELKSKIILILSSPSILEKLEFYKPSSTFTKDILGLSQLHSVFYSSREIRDNCLYNASRSLVKATNFEKATEAAISITDRKIQYKAFENIFENLTLITHELILDSLYTNIIKIIKSRAKESDQDRIFTNISSYLAKSNSFNKAVEFTTFINNESKAFEQELIVLSLCHNEKNNSDNIAKLFYENYLKPHNLGKAILIAKNFFDKSKHDSAFESIYKAALQANDFVNAIKAACSIHKKRDYLLNDIGEIVLKNNNFNKLIEAIESIVIKSTDEMWEKLFICRGISRALMKLNNFDKAIKVGRLAPYNWYIAHDEIQTLTTDLFKRICKAVIAANNFDKAIEAATSIPYEYERNSILDEIIHVFIKANNFDKVMEALSLIFNDDERNYTFSMISNDLIKGDTFDKVINAKERKDRAHIDISKTSIEANDFHTAIESAILIIDNEQRSSTFSRICKASIETNNFNEVIKTIESIAHRDTSKKYFICSNISRVLAKDGNFDKAMEIVALIPCYDWDVIMSKESAKIYRFIFNPIYKTAIEFNRCDEIIETVKSIPNDYKKFHTCSNIAIVSAENGNFDIAMKFVHLIIDDSYLRNSTVETIFKIQSGKQRD